MLGVRGIVGIGAGVGLIAKFFLGAGWGLSLKLGIAAIILAAAWPLLTGLYQRTATPTGTTGASGGGGSFWGKIWSLLIGVVLLVPATIHIAGAVFPNMESGFWFNGGLALGFLGALAAWALLKKGSGAGVASYAFFLMLVAGWHYGHMFISDRQDSAERFDLHVDQTGGYLNIYTDPFRKITVQGGDLVEVQVTDGTYYFPVGLKRELKPFSVQGDIANLAWGGKPFGRLELGAKPVTGGSALPLLNQTFRESGKEGAVLTGTVPEIGEGELEFLFNVPQIASVGGAKPREGKIRVRVAVQPVPRNDFFMVGQRFTEKLARKVAPIPVSLRGFDTPVMIDLLEIMRSNPGQHFDIDGPAGTIGVTADGRVFNVRDEIELGPQKKIWLKGPAGKTAYLWPNKKK